MIPEKQVVSFELSKELERAGYPQEGIWWWIIPIYPNGTPYLQDYNFVKPILIGLQQGKKRERIFVAPTVAELGERLAR